MQQVVSVQQSTAQPNKDVDEARKAVYEKNKVISDMFNRQNELNQALISKDEEIDKPRR